MTDGQPFRIRRINAPSPGIPAQPPEPAAEPPSSAAVRESVAQLADESRRLAVFSAVTFENALSTVIFLGALHRSRRRFELRLQRSAQRGWRAEVDVARAQLDAFVRLAGGTVEGSKLRGARPGAARDVPGWEAATLDDLLAALRLPVGTVRTGQHALIVLPEALLPWLTERALDAGLDGSVLSANPVRLAGGDGLADRIVVVSLTARKGDLPRAVFGAIARLPSSMIALPADESRRIYVDAMRRLPAGAAAIVERLPSGRVWLFGAPDIGHFTIEENEPAIDLTSLLRVGPDLAAPTAPLAPRARRSSSHPSAVIPVRLAADRTSRSRMDAVLLNREEVALALPLLRAWPVEDVAFQISGDPFTLVLAPGGLPRQIPIGVPLSLAPPGGLLIEEGLTFSPALPLDARRSVFDLRDDSLVVITANGGYRFDLNGLAPTWHLWVGAVPHVEPVLASRVDGVLAKIGAAASRAATAQAAGQPQDSAADRFRQSLKPSDRTNVLRDAQRAELRGDWVAAAELLEKIGEFARAGRLYMRAAEAAGRRR